MKSGFLSLAVAAFLFLPASASALVLPPNDGYVTDEADKLTDEQEALLEQDLTAYQKETSNEIAVVIVDSMSGAVIADTAIDLHRRWGVGDPDKDNGILMLIGYQDREAFISVGTGLEGAVPDIVANGIGERVMAPDFRDGEYYDGIAAGIDALKKHIGGEYEADRYDGDPDAAGAMGWLVFFLFIGLDWVAAMLGRTKSWWLGGILGALFGAAMTLLYGWWLAIPFLSVIGFGFDYVVSRTGYKGGRGGRGGGYWGGMGGGSGRSGGGFRGFGGGSTSGGGARFKW